MSVVPALSRPSFSTDSIPSPVERNKKASINGLMNSTLIPEVVVNGKKHDLQSYQRPHKSSTTSATSSAEDGWGSNFWVTLVDPQTSTAFYACPATGQVSWDPPVGNFVLPPSEEGEWWELADESRGGLPYYYQTKTGETVWERPEAFVIPLGILQNTSLARRLSARFSIGAQLDGDFPNRPINRRSRSFTSENQSPHNTNRRDETKVSQSSTKSASARIAPSASNVTLSMGKKAGQRIRRSSSSDQRNPYKNGTPLQTIPGSDISDPPTPASLASRKSVSSSNARPKQDTPPKRSGTSSSSSHNSSSLSRSKGKGYRPTQPQSLNAAVELFSSPVETTPPKDAVGLRHSKSTSSSKHSDSPAPSSQKKSVTIMPPSPRRPVPSAPATPTRSASMPSIVLRGKEISSPVLNREAAARLSPMKNRSIGQPILIAQNSQQSTRPSTGAFPILPQDLASDIQQFVQSDFAKQYFSTHRTGFIFRRTVPVEQLMKWQKTPMTSPLLTLHRSLHKNAVRIFKIIQRLMGDREEERPNGSMRRELSSPSINSLTGHEEERIILTEALTHGELRDEIYCQVMKQLVGNSNPESIFRGWQLLCVFLVTFPPSKNFEAYLKSFIQQRTTHSEGRVDVMAKYCLRRLAFISKKGPRGKPPSAWEIEMASDAAFNPSIFGESLDIIYRLQQRTYPQQKVPIILPFLADGILALGGTKSEGIFRVPGDGDGVSELKLRIDKGHYNLEGVEDPYVLASLMKLWLRELCDPLVPEEMYNSCVTSAKIPEACVELVQRLPTINRRVVLFLISFLQLFLDDKIQSITKMTPANLALVMAPNLLRCSSESMAVVFNNAQYEQEFVYHLLLNLKCNELDPDYVPTHGLGAIATSSSSQPRTSKSRNRRPG